MKSLAKLRGLSRRERRLLVGAALLLPLVHGGLVLLGYRRLQLLLEALAPLQPGAAPAPEAGCIPRGREIARMVSIASRHGLYRATCLRRSLAVWWLLRREGIQTRVRFGARVLDGRLEAHAWVEYQGVVINDSADIRDRFRPLYGTLPASETGL